MMRLRKLLRGWDALLATAVLVIFTLPVLWALGGAFWSDGLSMAHITFVFDDREYTWELVRNSAAMVALTTTLCMAAATPIGFLLFRTSLPGRGVLMALLVMAAAIPVYVVAGGWASVIGNDLWGRMEHWWQKVLVAGGIQAIAWFPWATLLAGLAFRAVDTDREEHGLLDANLGRLFLKVCIPDAFRGLAAISLLVAAFSLADVTITDCIGLATLQQECYLQFRLPSFNTAGDMFVLPKRAAAVAIPYVLAILAVGLFFAGRLKRQGTRGHASVEGPTVRLFRLRGVSGVTATALAWALPVALVALPMGKMIVMVDSVEILTNTWTSISRELKVTTLCALATAVVATVLGAVLAMLAVRTGISAWFARILIVLLIAIPAPLTGIAIAMNLNNDIFGPFYHTPAIYVYGMTLRFLPFAALIMIPEIARLPKILREQSLLEGCSTPRYALTVVLPNLGRGLATSALVCLILSIGELGCSVIIQSPGYATLSIRFFTMIHNGMDAGAAALALIAAVTVVLPAGILIALLRRLLARV